MTITMRGINKKLHPIAKIGLDGVEWEEIMRRWLTAAGAISGEEVPVTVTEE